tara:strand:+ start:3499 stop:3669 length:171 start_codon:yes stop_codon:yes gene_type:complete
MLDSKTSTNPVAEQDPVKERFEIISKNSTEGKRATCGIGKLGKLCRLSAFYSSAGC